MAAKTKVETYPVDESGNFKTYVESWHKYTMVPNVPFEAEMEIFSYSRGRSSATFDLRDVDTGKTYSMFMTDFLDLLLGNDIINARVKGHWVARKRGANYGIAYISKQGAEAWVS